MPRYNEPPTASEMNAISEGEDEPLKEHAACRLCGHIDFEPTNESFPKPDVCAGCIRLFGDQIEEDDQWEALRKLDAKKEF